MVELGFEIAATVGDRVETRGAEVDGVDGRDLVDHVLTHPADPVRVVEQILRDDTLVDRPREPLHHVEVAVEHVAGALVPPRARRPDGCGLQRAQDLELTLQVVRREQPWRRGPDPDDDVLGMVAVAVAPGDGEQQRLRAVAELDAIQAVDAHVLRVGELRREPRRQPALDVDVAHQLGAKRMGIRS